MTQNRKRLTLVLLILFASALAAGLSSACYGSHPFAPNFMPSDSLRKDTTQNQGLLIPSRPVERALA